MSFNYRSNVLQSCQLDVVEEMMPNTAFSDEGHFLGEVVALTLIPFIPSGRALNLEIMPLLLLVRHGQSVYNLEDRFTGGKDIALTDLGRKEAQLAGAKLKGILFNIAYTSVLKRAMESLKIILETIGEPQIRIVRNAALNERGYGRLEGLSKAGTTENMVQRR